MQERDIWPKRIATAEKGLYMGYKDHAGHSFQRVLRLWTLAELLAWQTRIDDMVAVKREAHKAARRLKEASNEDHVG